MHKSINNANNSFMLVISQIAQISNTLISCEAIFISPPSRLPIAGSTIQSLPKRHSVPGQRLSVILLAHATYEHKPRPG